jgi:hypothetical protein
MPIYRPWARSIGPTPFLTLVCLQLFLTHHSIWFRGWGCQVQLPCHDALLMNIDDRMGVMCVTRPVGTRGGCGAGWGPGACPGGNALHWGLRGAKRSHPQRGQAPGPLIHTPTPLVPTGPWDASISMDMITRFGRQHSVGYCHAYSHIRKTERCPLLSRRRALV